MKDSSVRLLRVKIQDFKNVVYGDIDFINPSRNGYKASVLGLYGQNGSGKTALIDAIHLMKYAMMGRQIPSALTEYIHVGAEKASLHYEFEITIGEDKYVVSYEFSIRKEKISKDNLTKISEFDIDKKPFKVTLFDEVLRYSPHSKEPCNIVLVDSRTEDYAAWLGNEFTTDLTVAQRVALRSSTSFVFSEDFRRILKERRESLECRNYTTLLNCLIFYAKYELFVLDTSYFDEVLWPLFMAVRNKGKNVATLTTVSMFLDKAVHFPQDGFPFIRRAIDNMNVVLSRLVPGLELGIRNLGSSVSKDGKKQVEIQLMSRKGGREIPFLFESRGIKKIVSVLQLLIAVYNQESITVAIDELDSGVFEYLLGEILEIISEQGEGQLIFTSHNLRPLETLDKGFVAFTTVNPSNRYTRMTGIKDNQNLRDFYFRDIVLGGQEEPLYEPTNNAEIALAFREAWGYGE